MTDKTLPTNLKNEKGGIILAMVLALGIAYTTISFFLYADATAKIQKMLDLSNSTSIEFVKNSIPTLIFDSYALTRTIYDSDNSLLKSCIENPSFNCPRGKHSLKVYDLKQDIYSSANSTRGFKLQWTDADGFECSSYSSSGNANCPFKYFFYWQADCPPSGACLAPNINIIGELNYSPPAGSGHKMNINFKKYNLTFNVK